MSQRHGLRWPLESLDEVEDQSVWTPVAQLPSLGGEGSLQQEREKSLLILMRGDCRHWFPREKLRLDTDGCVWACDEYLRKRGLDDL